MPPEPSRRVVDWRCPVDEIRGPHRGSHVRPWDTDDELEERLVHVRQPEQVIPSSVLERIARLEQIIQKEVIQPREEREVLMESIRRLLFERVKEEGGVDAVEFARLHEVPLASVYQVVEEFTQRGWLAQDL